MHSLRVRLLVVTVMVAAAAVGVSALFSRQVVTSEFRRFVQTPHASGIDGVVRALEATSSYAGADSVLERLAPAVGRALVVVDSAGVVIAASDSPLRAATVTRGDGGRVSFDARSGGGRRAGGMMLELVNPPRHEIRSPDGALRGTLYVLPEPQTPSPPGRPFLQRVDRGLWLGALSAIALGAVLVTLLSSRIVGPIEKLTVAARRMERGDLSPRVAARGNDEVAVLGRSFNAMAESLEHTQRTRRQLTHDIAHELRTPLTNLRAQIEALEDGLLQPDRSALGSLHEEVMLLARLTDDLGQLAMAESGALRLDLETIAVREALERAAAAFQVQAAAGGIEVRIEADSELEVRADAARLGQILRNLTTNALTYTPPGGHITLAAHSEDARVVFEVRDSGSGIPAEHLPHVFERFHRADPSRSRTTGGAGLGLAIVRHLVAAQGGETTAASEPGQGTTLRFTLPRA